MPLMLRRAGISRHHVHSYNNSTRDRNTFGGSHLLLAKVLKVSSVESISRRRDYGMASTEFNHHIPILPVGMTSMHDGRCIPTATIPRPYNEPTLLQCRSLRTDICEGRPNASQQANMKASTPRHILSNPTLDEKISMELLARSIFSSRHQKNESTEMNDRKEMNTISIFQDASKVINYYADTQTDGLRSLPLSNDITSKSSPSLALDGPYVCHSILTSILLPQLLQERSDDTISHKELVDLAISMSLSTLQSFVDLVCTKKSYKVKSPRQESFSDSSDVKDQYVNIDSLMQDGTLAEEILRLLLSLRIDKEYEDKQKLRSKKLLLCFNETMNLWVHIGSSLRHIAHASKEAALRAENLLLDLILSRNNRSNSTLKGDNDEGFLRYHIIPNTVSFNIVINAWSTAAGSYGRRNSSTSIECAERAESILNMMHTSSDIEDVNDANDEVSIRPDQLSYDQVIQAYASCKYHDDAPNRALTVLEQMLERNLKYYDGIDKSSTRIKNHPPFPTNYTLSSLLKAWAVVRPSISQQQAIDEAEALFSRLVDLDKLVPDTVVFNTLLSIYWKQQTGFWDTRKKDKRSRRQKKNSRDEFHFKSSDEMLMALKDQFGKCQRMEEIVQNMNVHGCTPDVITYNYNIMAWTDLLQMPQQVLRYKENLRPREIAEVQRISLECVEKLKSNIFEMIKLLSEMDEDMIQHRYEGHLKNASKVITSTLKMYRLIASPDAIEAAESFLKDIEDYLSDTERNRYLQRMMEPNLYHYSVLMAAYSQIGTVESAQKVELIYDRLCEKQRKIPQEQVNKNIALCSFQPDTKCWNTMLYAWCKVGTIDALRRAESLLDNLIQEYDHDSSCITPDHFSFSTLFQAYMKLEDSNSAESMERILLKMIKAKETGFFNIPDKDLWATFNVLIKKYGEQGSTYDKSIAALEMMTANASESETDEIASSQIVKGFNICMNHIAKEGNPHRVEGIFNMLEDRFRNNSSYVVPDGVTYSTLLNAWAMSDEKNAPLRVKELLDKNIQAYHYQMKNGRKRHGNNTLRPDIARFNLVFKACAKASPTFRRQRDRDIPKEGKNTDVKDLYKNQPLGIALATLSDIQSGSKYNWHVEPTHATYTSLFTIIRKHMPDDDTKKHELVFALMKKCCDDGYLTEMVLHKFRQTISNDRVLFDHCMERIVSNKSKNRASLSSKSWVHWKDIDDFPHQWRRKAPKGYTKKGQRW